MASPFGRRHRYATILTDAETGERIDVLPDRGADTLERWLRVGLAMVGTVPHRAAADGAKGLRR
ncbi:hypothetical protein [Streptomyces sp. NPDC057301]|uniref:hypothetical protein n=1 Tax=Streptomyces sp. NPDC057301 TaxID=3346093 RepID=UPI0036384DAD